MSSFSASSTGGARGRTMETGGSQYLALRYSRRAAETDMTVSVMSTGSDYDNSLAEAMSRRYKTEQGKRNWPWRSRSQLDLATLDWALLGALPQPLATGGPHRLHAAGKG